MNNNANNDLIIFTSHSNEQYIALPNNKNINCYWVVTIQCLHSSKTLTRLLRELPPQLPQYLHDIFEPLLLYTNKEYNKLYEYMSDHTLRPRDGYDSNALISLIYLPIIHNLYRDSTIKIITEIGLYRNVLYNYPNPNYQLESIIPTDNHQQFRDTYMLPFSEFITSEKPWDHLISNPDVYQLLVYTEDSGHVLTLLRTNSDKILVLDDARNYMPIDIYIQLRNNIKEMKIPAPIEAIKLILSNIKLVTVSTTPYYTKLLPMNINDNNNNSNLKGGFNKNSNTFANILLFILSLLILVLLIIVTIIVTSYPKQHENQHSAQHNASTL